MKVANSPCRGVCHMGGPASSDAQVAGALRAVVSNRSGDANRDRGPRSEPARLAVVKMVDPLCQYE